MQQRCWCGKPVAEHVADAEAIEKAAGVTANDKPRPRRLTHAIVLDYNTEEEVTQ